MGDPYKGTGHKRVNPFDTINKRVGHTLSGSTRLTQLGVVGEIFFLVLKLIFNNLKIQKIQIRIKKIYFKKKKKKRI